MKFFYSNSGDAATLTASSENADFPAVNVQNYLKGKLWKTLGSAAAESLVFDLGSAAAMKAIILFNHNFDGTETNIRLEANSSSSWGSPPYTETLTYAAGTITKQFNSAGSSSYRYWRLAFTKASAASIKSIGRIFLGSYFDSTAEGDPDFTGVTETTIDPSELDRSIGNQKYAAIKAQYRQYDLDVSMAPESIVTTFKAVFAALGIHAPFFLQVSTLTPLDEYLYLGFRDKYTRKVAGYGSQLYWDSKFQLEEWI